ncbi:MAG TPA: Uma2 family endonuclease [Gemmataceae bacterium]|nr:Uma2 family endonuclease [Gemmataceae bacterium]
MRLGPDFGRATEADVLRLLDAPDKRVCELIDGVLVEKPMGFKESTIAAIIVQHINNYLDDNDLGLAFCPDAPIRVKPGRIRFPDTGFVSWKRFPHEAFPDDKVIDVMADLAVEVLSEGNTPKEMDLKLDEYFAAGVKLVWYVDPEAESVTVYTSRSSKKVLGIDGVLDGGKVLPGFTLPVRKLFARIHRRKKKR